MRNGVFPTAANQAHDFTVIHNSISDINSVCGISNVIFNVFDPINFLPWLNALPGDPSQYGSDPVCAGDRKYNFQFNILDINKRKSALDFLNLIPPGYYVVFRNTSGIDPASNTYAKDWKADTTVFGAGNSLYHKLEEQGVVTDSFYFPRSFLFAFRKDMKHQFTPVSKFSEGIYDRISLATDCPTDFTEGTVLSPEFGPAKAWKRLTWNGKSNEQPVADIPSISLIGITQAGGEVELKTLGLSSQDVDISDIDARQYPFLKLSLHCRDTVKATPYQLNFWRVVYDPAPEGALAPNIFFTSKDTIELGEPLNFGIAFKNVSEINFDSLKLKVILTDKNNVPKEIPFGLLKPVQHGDTVVFRYTIDTKSLPGLNTIFVEFNPDNHQPEQYHFNNFLYRNFYARYDKQDPVLDVTFDGSHILNGDIVSGRPFIQIKLKDESKFRLLKDTSVMKLWVKFPDGTRRSYRYDSDTVRFIPAIDGSDNTATIEFRPSFLQSFREDGIDNYELIVSAQDASNNPAGKIDYNISFLVINKPMISNLLNYPNPFTTSTAFVFTITGSEIPDNFKIQVLTVTGKIVREITKDELGPLRIGRNITEFKWDGTDQYGQRLGNGVYLYRVISTLHGKEMDKYRAEKDNTDKFFTRGYGKMYLMR